MTMAMLRAVAVLSNPIKSHREEKCREKSLEAAEDEDEGESTAKGI